MEALPEALPGGKSSEFIADLSTLHLWVHVQLQDSFCKRHGIRLPPLQTQFDYHSLVLLYKMRSSLAPPYLCSLLPRQASATTGYSFQKSGYPVPATRKSSTLSSFVPRSSGTHFRRKSKSPIRWPSSKPDKSTARSVPYEVFLPWLERRWLVNAIETITWHVGNFLSAAGSTSDSHSLSVNERPVWIKIYPTLYLSDTHSLEWSFYKPEQLPCPGCLRLQTIASQCYF